MVLRLLKPTPVRSSQLVRPPPSWLVHVSPSAYPLFFSALSPIHALFPLQIGSETFAFVSASQQLCIPFPFLPLFTSFSFSICLRHFLLFSSWPLHSISSMWLTGCFHHSNFSSSFHSVSIYLRWSIKIALTLLSFFSLILRCKTALYKFSKYSQLI